MMVRVVLPVFPAASTFVYVSVYVPAVVVFTEPELAVLIVPVPSILSDQVAPGSVYVEPCAIFAIPDPTRLTTGATRSGGTTFTVRVIVTPVPEVSVYVYSSIYVPTVLISTVPDDATLIVPLPSSRSVHVAPGSRYPVPYE